MCLAEGCAAVLIQQLSLCDLREPATALPPPHAAGVRTLFAFPSRVRTRPWQNGAHPCTPLPLCLSVAPVPPPSGSTSPHGLLQLLHVRSFALPSRMLQRLLRL